MALKDVPLNERAMDTRAIKSVKSIGAWAEVELYPGCMASTKHNLTLQPLESALRFPQYVDHELPNHLFIPRAAAHGSGIEVNGKWDALNVGRKAYTYRPGQQETIEAVMQALAERSRYGGILQAVTGAGKTVMAIDLMIRLGLKTLIVVPRTSLVTQWVERLCEYTSLTIDDIGIIQGPNCPHEKRVCVAMIHSLAQKMDDYPSELRKTFGTVIFDETHVLGADTFSQVAPAFASKYRLGLSATPRRADGMDGVFLLHIGPIVARFTKLQATPRIRIISYKGRDTSHAGCVWGGKLSLGRYINRVARSTDRLDLLRRIVLALDAKDHDILVLSERIQQLRQLKALLIRDGVDENKIGMLIGNEKQKDRKIILGTYGSAGMGVDIPRLTALVLATPRADIEQALGRVLRQGRPIVFDIVDDASSIMKAWGYKRLKFYRQTTDDIKFKAA